MSKIALIKQLTLCFVFMLAAVLVQSAQGVQAAGGIAILSQDEGVDIFQSNGSKGGGFPRNSLPTKLYAIAFSNEGFILVLGADDSGQGTVLCIDPAGPSLLNSFATGLAYPVDMAVDPVGGTIAILDQEGNGEVFQPNGSKVAEFGRGIFPTNFSNFSAIAFSNEGFLLVLGADDSGKATVQCVDPAGPSLRDACSFDTGLAAPVDMAVDPVGGTIAIIDQEGNGDVFQPNGSYVTGFARGMFPTSFSNFSAIAFSNEGFLLVLGADGSGKSTVQCIDLADLSLRDDCSFDTDLAAPVDIAVGHVVCGNVNDKVDFVVKGWKFDSTVKRTPISPTAISGETKLLGAGGVLDQLYGLNNLIRIDNDQIWTNLDGGATAKAMFTGRNKQILCYIDANNVFQQIFTATENCLPISTIPGKDRLPTFRWGLMSAGHKWSSRPSDNSDKADHMVTWLIKGDTSAGKFVIAWEDLCGLGDKDYQDLVVEIDNVSTLTDQIGTFTITAELTNTSVEKIYAPVKAVVNTLEYTDAVSKQFPLILLSATEGDGTKDSKQTIDVGEGVLVPYESVTVDFVIGLSVRSRFSFLVDVEGCL